MEYAEKNKNSPDATLSEEIQEHPLKTTVAFGFGAFADQMSHQMFQFLVFTYYFAVVNIPVQYIMVAFIIFAVWDSINDPLIGPISDRTQSKHGRRGFWILFITIPFGLVNIFLFTPPKFWPTPMEGLWPNLIYMLVIIMLYDLFYTVFSSNQLSLFPEMFKTEKARARANKFKNILTIVGVLLGFVLPTLIITDLIPSPDISAAEVNRMYIFCGIFIGVLVILLGFLFFKYGMKEDPVHLTKPEEAMGIWQSLGTTLRNRSFLIFVFGNLFTWFIFKMLTTIISLYGIYVLGITKGNILLTVMLLAAFLTAAAMFPIMEKLGNRFGMRNAFIMTNSFWIISLIPFYFLDNQPIIAVICMIFVGVGLSGAMYFVDIIIGRIIDEDEIHTGKRRQGAYYGVNALINRYSTILVFLAIALVLRGYGWDQFIVNASADDIENIGMGLKLLMTPISIGGLLVVIFLLWRFPLHGEKWEQVKQELAAKRAQENINLL